MAVNQQVSVLADAYRAAMRDGDTALDSPAEKKILQAIVAASADDTAVWVSTRLPGGTDAAAPLRALLPDLQRRNVVGDGLTAAKNQAQAQATAVVTSLFLQGTWPLWLSTLASIIGGALGFAYSAGDAIATAAIPLLLGGGSAVGLLVRAIANSGAALTSVGDSAGSLVDKAGSVGRPAEEVFQRKVGAQLTALRGAPGPIATPVVGQVRSSAQAIVFIAFGVAIIFGLFFLGGVWHAVSAYHESQRCPLYSSSPLC